jgi:hypothetical protein
LLLTQFFSDEFPVFQSLSKHALGALFNLLNLKPSPMKKILTTLTTSLVLMSTCMNAQVPAWGWAKSSGGSQNDGSGSVYVDANGNVFVTGTFSSSTITFGTTVLTNNGGIDFYIVKYDPTGNVLWAKGANGSSNDVGNSIAVDPSGNVFVLGSTNSFQLTFGTTMITQHGADDIFLVKYDALGNVLWAKSYGSSGNDIGTSIAVDGSGAAYITGYYASSSVSFGTSTVTNLGTNNIFVAKLDASGTVLWAKNEGGSGDDRPLGIAADGNGNAFVTGFFSSSSILFGTTTLNNSGSDDYFLLKFDSSGNPLWAKGANGASNDIGYNVKTDATGNVYVIGSFNSSTLTFGTITVNLHAFDDFFIVKYDGSGNVLWAKENGSSGNDIGEAIGVDGSGNVYVTGYFASPSLTFGTSVANNLGANNIFVAKYDGNGNALWGKSAGSTGDDRASSLAMDVNGNVYIAGYFTSSSVALGANNLTNMGSQDMYVAKMNSGSNGILEIGSLFETVTAYPNPSNGIFELQLPQELSSASQITVMDMMGKEVYNSQIHAMRTDSKIDLSDHASGMYYVVVTNGEMQYRSKVMVNK